jgi:murein peptide amidase A
MSRPPLPSPASSSADPGPIDPVAFAARFEQAARDGGFRVERYGEVRGLPLLAFTRRTPGPRPRIYLSAGIHGDEPAPPLALLSLLERGVFDDRAGWFICPLLNPVGFTVRTRENSDGLDLNRDYKALRSIEIQAHARWLQRQPNFDVALCAHEDWEARGFYLYELNPTGRRSLAPAMITSAADVCPLETATVIDGRAIAEPAIIRPVADPALRDLWPESIYLRAHHTSLTYTLETPSSLPLTTRIATLEAVITAAVRLAASDPSDSRR